MMPQLSLPYKRQINLQLIEALNSAHQNFLQSVKQIGIEKLVVGLSGGLDSVIASALLKSSGVNAYLVIVEVDDENTLSEQTEFAISMAKKIQLPYEVINASRVYKELIDLSLSDKPLTRVHLRSRLINNIILKIADQQDGFIIDTTDKSEKILKLHEESFHGHFAPLISFYKSELYDMADYFNLSEVKKYQSGCPELINFDVFGASWECLDPIIHLITEQNLSYDDIATRYKIDREWLQKLERRITTQLLRTNPTLFQAPNFNSKAM